MLENLPDIDGVDPKAVHAFDEALGNRCIDPDFNWFRERYQRFTGRLRPYYNDRLTQQFYFDFLDFPDANAVATFNRGYALVGCHRGTFSNLGFLFDTILAQPDLLSNIGDPSAETSWLLSMEACDWSREVSEIASSMTYKNVPQSSRPRCPDRQVFSERLLLLSMDFLFFHEVSHILNRHLSLLREITPLAALSEKSSVVKYLSPLDYQALEFNADADGATILCADWYRAPDRNTMPFGSFESNIEALAFVVHMLCMLWEPQRVSIDAYNTCRHPHPGVRLLNIHRALMAMAREDRLFEARVTSGWQVGLENTLSVCDRLGIQSGVQKAYSDKEFSSTFLRYQEIATHFDSKITIQLDALDEGLLGSDGA